VSRVSRSATRSASRLRRAEPVCSPGKVDAPPVWLYFLNSARSQKPPSQTPAVLGRRRLGTVFTSYLGMSRRLRYVPDGGALVEVTCRTLHSRYLLRPATGERLSTVSSTRASKRHRVGWHLFGLSVFLAVLLAASLRRCLFKSLQGDFQRRGDNTKRVSSAIPCSLFADSAGTYLGGI